MQPRPPPVRKRVGDEYVINGNKVMISNGTEAKFLLVFCLTHPEETSKSNRHSILLVETDRPGYKADKIHGKDGASCFRYRQYLFQ